MIDKMKTGYVFINNNVLPTLLAQSYFEQAQGLMYVEPPTPIMTFVYASPQINRFWMSNTPSPLDIVFCKEGKVSQICYGEPFSTAMIGGNIPSDLVVELPYGSVERFSIKVGQEVGIFSV